MKRVEVHWLDAVALNHGWETPRHYVESSRGATVMLTTGYLVRKTKHNVLVAHSKMATNGKVDYVMSIPRSQVRRIRKLR